METKKVTVEGKEYEIHEILAYQFDEALEQEKWSERQRLIVMGCSEITEEDYKKLTFSNREKLLKVINEVNVWGKSPAKTN